MYELSETLQKRLDDLTKISLAVNNIYSNLCLFEKDGKKDSDEFRKYVDYLQIALEIENEKIKKLSYNEENIGLLVYHLEEKFNLHGVDIYHDYMYLNEEAKVATRIITTLDAILDEIYCGEDYDHLAGADLYQIYNYITKTLLYNNLKKMDEQIKGDKTGKLSRKTDDNLGCLRDLYLDYKYNMAFVNKEIEQNFLSNNFNTADILILKPLEQARILGLSVKEYNDLKKYDIINKTLDNISVHGSFSNLEMLLPPNVKRKVITLWSIINGIKVMDYHQLLEVKASLNYAAKFTVLNPKSKKIVLAILNDNLAPFLSDQSKIIKNNQVYIKRKNDQK